MALTANMIHLTRALYREMVDDEVASSTSGVLLPKAKLIDMFTNHEPTKRALGHISGFIYHAVSVPGSYEVALDRMKTKVSGKLDMDEFLAFINTAAMSMAKGHTANNADLMRGGQPELSSSDLFRFVMRT